MVPLIAHAQEAMQYTAHSSSRLVLQLYYQSRAAGLEASGVVLVLRLVLKLYYRSRAAVLEASGGLGSKWRRSCTTACIKVVLPKSSGGLGSKRSHPCIAACTEFVPPKSSGELESWRHHPCVTACTKVVLLLLLLPLASALSGFRRRSKECVGAFTI